MGTNLVQASFTLIVIAKTKLEACVGRLQAKSKLEGGKALVLSEAHENRNLILLYETCHAMHSVLSRLQFVALEEI